MNSRIRSVALAVAWAAFGASAALAQDVAKTAPAAGVTQTAARITTPGGVTISYPSASSGLPINGTPMTQASPGPHDQSTLGIFAIATPPPSPTLPAPMTLQPNGSTAPMNLSSVQAFASGAPNAGVDSAPLAAPTRPGIPNYNWASPARRTAGCPWEYRRRLICE